MGLSNFPNGISSFGVPVLPGGMYFDRILWVNSANGSGGNYGGAGGNSPDRPLASMFGTGGAWARAVAGGNGTLVICMKGHTETISAADFGSDLGSNKRIYCVSQGDEVERANLTWSAAASTLLLDTDSMVLDNFNLNLDPGAGTVNVAAPITVSGNGCGLRRCKIRAGTDANSKVTTGITFTGADCFLEDVFYYGAVAAGATNHIVLTGTARFKVRGLYMDAATTANAVGCVQSVTTANTMMDWADFRIANSKSGSTAAVTGIAGDTGFVRNGHLHITANGTIATDQAGAWTTKGNVVFAGNIYVTDNVGEVGVALLPASA